MNLISIVVLVLAAGPDAELFRDRGDVFVRAGTVQGLKVGAQVPVMGVRIGNTDEYRTAGHATVLEVWAALSRVSLDAGAQASVSVLPDGQSIGVVELPAPLPSIAQTVAEHSAPDHHGSVFLDPAGFLFFGPSFGLEVGGGRFTGSVYGRWLDAGLLGNVTLLSTGDRFQFSFGIGARGRFYFADGFAGAHLGLGVEWLRSVVDNSVLLLTMTTNYLIPQIEGGYRWAWSHVFLGLSASAGYAVLLFWRTENLPGGHLAAEVGPSVDRSFYGAAKLEFGVFF